MIERIYFYFIIFSQKRKGKRETHSRRGSSRGQYQFLEVVFFSATYKGPGVQNNLGGPDQLAGNTNERPT